MTAHRPEVGDEVVDAVAVHRQRGLDQFLVRLSAPEAEGVARRVLENFATVLRWSDVRFLAEGVATGASRVTDLGGFAYPPASGLDEGVVLVDGGDNEVVVSRPAFTRLFSRLLDALVEGAVSDHDPVTAEPWWPELVKTADTVRKDAAKGG